MELWILWLILVFFLIVLEVCTVNLVSIWFILSGLVSLLVSVFYDNFLVQFAIFVLLGVFLLLTTRKFLKRYIEPNKENEFGSHYRRNGNCYRNDFKKWNWRSKSWWKKMECDLRGTSRSWRRDSHRGHWRCKINCEKEGEVNGNFNCYFSDCCCCCTTKY